MFDARHGWILVVLVIPPASCGERTIDLDRECVRVQVLEVYPDRVTRSGRTFAELSDWSIGQIEPDGSFTTVMQLDVDLDIVDYRGAIEHDPESGRMWLLAWSYDAPPWLFQFDASGQIEWADELSELGGVVTYGSLLHHDGALVIAVRVEVEWPGTLVVERRDLAGEVVWTRGELPTPDGGNVFASAGLIGVADGALAMIATPPLIDYGPSYPLTLDFASGEPIWSGEDGHDPLALIVDDERLVLAWTSGPRFDVDQLPEQRVEIERASSSLQVVTPAGDALTQADVEWPKGWRVYDDDRVALARMGDRLVSLVEGTGTVGVTVHDRDGELECQGTLADVDRLDWAIGLDGREQALAAVAVRTGELDDHGEHQTESRVLLLEPL